MNVIQDIKDEIAHVCAVDPQRVREDAWLIEYGLDSVRSMELIIALEEHFEIELPDSEIAVLQTVGDVVQLVQHKLDHHNSTSDGQ